MNQIFFKIDENISNHKIFIKIDKATCLLPYPMQNQLTIN